MVDKPSKKEMQRIIRRMGTGANLDGSKTIDCYDDQARPSDISPAEAGARWDLAFGRITIAEFDRLKENNYGLGSDSEG